MSVDDARKQAEQFFRPRVADDKSTPDYEARSRDIRQKIEYLRSLRLAAQAHSKDQNDPSK